jgi:hypothetical protein
LLQHGFARLAFRFVAFFAVTLALSACGAKAQTVIGEFPHPAAFQVTQSPTGFTAHNDFEALEVTVCDDSRVHVVARSAQAPPANQQQPWMLSPAQSCPGRLLPVQ